MSEPLSPYVQPSPLRRPHKLVSLWRKVLSRFVSTMIAVMRGLLPLWMAFSLVLVGVFGLEVSLPASPMTETGLVSVDSLLAFGAGSRDLIVGQGQWWRVVTSELLHSGLYHLLANVTCLTVIGWVLEPLIGPAWFSAIFALSAMSGSAVAFLTGPSDRLIVGISDGTTGLLAAGLMISFHLPAGISRYRLQAVTLLGLALALIPFSSPRSDFAISYRAHDAGAVCGLAVGLVMLLVWPKTSSWPRFTSIAGAIAISSLALTGIALFPAFANYNDASLRRLFFSPFPKSDEEALAQAPAMLAVKPHDPRARYAYAMTFEKSLDFSTAEAELSKALSEKDLLSYLDPPHYEDQIRVDLGYVLVQENRIADARVVTAPACVTEPTGRLHDWLIRLQLCH